MICFIIVSFLTSLAVTFQIGFTCISFAPAEISASTITYEGRNEYISTSNPNFLLLENGVRLAVGPSHCASEDRKTKDLCIINPRTHNNDNMDTYIHTPITRNSSLWLRLRTCVSTRTWFTRLTSLGSRDGKWRRPTTHGDYFP